jgi:hypothetical protein
MTVFKNPRSDVTGVFVGQTVGLSKPRNLSTHVWKAEITYHESTRLNKYVDCASLANDPILISAGEAAVNIC